MYSNARVDCKEQLSNHNSKLYSNWVNGIKWLVKTEAIFTKLISASLISQKEFIFEFINEKNQSTW